jgi:hypothetical protein
MCNGYGRGGASRMQEGQTPPLAGQKVPLAQVQFSRLSWFPTLTHSGPSTLPAISQAQQAEHTGAGQCIDAEPPMADNTIWKRVS